MIISTFLATLSPMLVMFLCIVIGYVLYRAHILPKNSATVLSKLETWILGPAVTIRSFIARCTVPSLVENYPIILYSIGVVAIAVLVSRPLSRLFSKEPYIRNVYRYGLTTANYGYMGNAIVPALFGEDVFFRYLLFTMPLNMVVFSWGMLLLIPQGEVRKPLYRRLCNPPLIGLLIGMFLGLTGIGQHLPTFVSDTLGNLASCMGPIAMVLTGCIIAEYGVLPLLKKGRVYGATLLRLTVLPIALVALLWLVSHDADVCLLALFAYATPLGLNTVVYPAAYGHDSSIGASMAMISHTACVFTIPLLYALFCAFIR